MSTSGEVERVSVAVADGTRMVCHVARPPAHVTNPPGILIFQEAFGVNEYLRAVTARFAKLGFVALAPELYHRSGDGIVGAYDGGRGEMTPYSNALTLDGTIADIRSAYDWLLTEGAAGRGVAAVGFCMGGRTAYLANAQVPLKAAISFYGGGIPRWFEFLNQQQAPLLCFWGRRDESIPLSQAREVADAFDAAGLVHTQVIFSTAAHGFFRHVRKSDYDPQAAHLAWEASCAFLRDAGLTD